MTIRSMTGYGAAEGQVSLTGEQIREWRWELKSVNGRGLDLRLKLPSGYDFLDPLLRARASTLTRGNISATLTLSVTKTGANYAIDQHALAAVSAAIAEIRIAIEATPPTADAILSAPGVFRPAETKLDETSEAQWQNALLQGFDEACSALERARAAEGAQIAKCLIDQVESVARLTEAAASLAPTVQQHHFETLSAQIKDLLGPAGITDERCVQEAALLAVKSDIREEIDRLHAHVAAGRELLSRDDAIGRQFDFLAQEFLREANTLTTKAPTTELKQIGLELKGVIDQLKEQVQNVL